MSTVRANTFQSNTGGRPQITGGALCLAHVNFNDAGTINQQFNVSSITRNAFGDHTINFTNALADANYTVVFGHAVSTPGAGVGPFGVQTASLTASPTLKSTTQLRTSGPSSASAVAYFGLAVFGAA